MEKKQISAIVKTMALEEKLLLLSGGGIFETRELETYGIPELVVMDGGTGFNTMQMGMLLAQKAGRDIEKPDLVHATEEELERDGASVRFYFFRGNPEKLNNEEQRILKKLEEYKKEYFPDYDTVGCYPPGMLLGATWNPEAVYDCANALGREANYRGIDILLGTPNVNIHRDPRCGRLFEGYSEDPYLVAALAPEFVKGIQDAGVIANVKHFAANNQETDRMGVDEHISERALREIYFPGFEACIKDGKCKTVMSSYNKINGVANSQNRWLLTDVLRHDWGFDGAVMSDWNGVYDWQEAVKAGNDLAMPGPLCTEILKKAIKDKRLSETDVDVCVERILNMISEAPSVTGNRIDSVDWEQTMDAAYQAAAEGIVLLKNNGVLPLSRECKVAFYGERCQKLVCCGEGSAEVVTNRNTNPFDCAREKLGEKQVLFEKADVDTDAIIVVVSVTGQEGRDRCDLRLPEAAKQDLKRAIAKGKELTKPVIAILNVMGPVELEAFEQDLDAVLCAWLPGMGGGKALTDILFGDVNPSGKLPITFPKKYKDAPTYLNFPGEYADVNYGEGIYVGYRYYDVKEIEPMYAFGYGLSYTTFEIIGVKVPDSVDFRTEDEVWVKVKVRNTGERGGKEVVQIYVEDSVCRLERPVKELKGFQKIFLNPGEEACVEISLNKRAFQYYDPKLGRWAMEKGTFVIHVGTGSRQIAYSVPVEIHCRNDYPLGAESTIEEIWNQKDALAIVEKELPELDVEKDLKSVMIFNPKMPFRQFWDETVTGLLKEMDEGQMERRFEGLMDLLERV